jgi:hypothetical protein
VGAVQKAAGMKPEPRNRSSRSAGLPDRSDVTQRSDNERYLTPFSGKEDDTKLTVALERAHDTRKFEIELYWKRATYFWAFNTVIFAGYFAVSNKDNASNDLLFAINCLGFLFSSGWYLANRGSKFWQLNWETHVDLLEDKVTGPLYKTTLDPPQFRFSNLTGPYAFSVSRLNTVLSAYVVTIWIFLGIRSLTAVLNWAEPFPGVNIGALTLLTIFFAVRLFSQGKSELEDTALVLRRRKVRILLNADDDASEESA